jgi:CTD kinase subunit alpha
MECWVCLPANRRCILLELIEGEATFRGTNEIEQLEQIFRICGTPKKGDLYYQDLPWWALMRPKAAIKRELKAKFAGRVSIPGLDLIDKLLSLEPGKRPTCVDVLAHAYFTSDDPPACLPKEYVWIC